MENKRKNKSLLVLTLGIILFCSLMLIFLASGQEITAEQWGVKVYSTEFAGGDGTANSPYQISTPEQFARMNFLLRTDYSNYGRAYYKIVAPIDLKIHDGQNMVWPAMGTSSNPFAGNFDGGGQRITGLNIVANDNACGLFAYSSGVIKNVIILESKIENVSCDSNIGGIVGKSTGGEVSSCYVDMEINASGKVYVGGVVGNNEAILNKIQFTGSVVARQCVGGICGLDYSANISNCGNSGKVTATTWVGGICGYVSNKSESDKTNFDRAIKFCYNKGNVVASNKSVAGGYNGGIVGRSRYCSVSNCYNIANLENCAGIVGQLDGNRSIYNSGSFKLISIHKISYCYNLGTLTSTEGYVGGIASYVECGEIQRCYNAGTIEGGDYSAGIVGSSLGTIYISKSFNYAEINGKAYIGGLLGDVAFAGNANSMEIIDSGNSGKINSSYGGFVGGIAGRISSYLNEESSANESYKISTCFSIGDVNANSGNYVGGIVGDLRTITSMEFSNNYSDCNLTARQSNYVGGLVGYMNAKTGFTFENCFSRGNVSGKTNVGGIFGYGNEDKKMFDAEVVLKNIQSLCSVTASDKEYVGAFGGRDDSNKLQYESCHYFYNSGKKGLGTKNGNGTNTSGLDQIDPPVNYKTMFGSAFTSASTANIYGIQLKVFNDNGNWKVLKDFAGDGYSQTREYELKCFTQSPFNSSKELIFDDNIWQVESSVNGGHPFLREFYWIYVS